MIPERVQTILDQHQLEALEFEPGSTPTSDLAAKRIGVAVGQIAKSMVFKGKDGRFFLIVCPGDRRICSKKVRKVAGTKARMARHEEAELATGYKPGGVCPFGVEGIDIYIDIGLSKYETIYPAAGNDASGVPVSFERLRSMIGATEVDVML